MIKHLYLRFKYLNNLSSVILLLYTNNMHIKRIKMYAIMPMFNLFNYNNTRQTINYCFKAYRYVKYRLYNIFKFYIANTFILQNKI